MSIVKINEQTFPILACLDHNILNDSLQYVLENSGYEERSWKSIQESFAFFMKKTIEIDYLSIGLHQKLLAPAFFEQHKSLLDNSRESTGLLLLPETIYSDFSQVPDYVQVDEADYPINAILYSWLPIDDHDRLTGNFDEDEPWHKPQERSLLILPICDDRITQATDQRHLISYSEEYGMACREGSGREWYGKIHDYVMSYLISERLRNQKSLHSNFKTIKYQLEYVDNPYGNSIKIIDLIWQ
jgi:hypothetical protein